MYDFIDCPFCIFDDEREELVCLWDMTVTNQLLVYKADCGCLAPGEYSGVSRT